MGTQSVIAQPNGKTRSRAPDILDRTFQFALRIVRLTGQLPGSRTSQLFARQLARAGTSVGANVEEAQGSSTKKEFVRRMNIARGEARETLYWLRLLAASELVAHARLGELIKEADELVSILTAIVKRSGR